METNGAFQAREKNPADLPNSDIIQKWSKLLAPKWTDRIGAQGKQMRPEHCINEIHPGCPGVTFPMTYASIMPEVSLPRWKHIHIWIFSGKHTPGPPYFIVHKNNSTHQMCHCKIQPKLQSWQSENILMVGLKDIWHKGSLFRHL